MTQHGVVKLTCSDFKVIYYSLKYSNIYDKYGMLNDTDKKLIQYPIMGTLKNSANQVSLDTRNKCMTSIYCNHWYKRII